MKKHIIKHQYLVLALTILTWMAISQVVEPLRIANASQDIEASSIELSNEGDDFVVFSSDGNTLASTDFDGQIMLWDVVTGQARATLPNPFTSLVNSIVFSPDGNTLASVRDNSIQLWDITSGDVRLILSESVFVTDLVFSPNSKSLAALDQDARIMLWDVQSGSASQALNDKQGDVSVIAFSPNSSVLATGDQNNQIKLWDIDTGFELASLIGDSNSAVTDLLFSPNGKTLVAVGQDDRITLWDSQSGSITRGLAGHQSAVNAIVFSPDSTIIATGGQDAQIKLWDVETGREQASLVGEADIAITGLVYSPDGKILASLAESESVLLWNVSSKLPQLLTGHVDWVDKVVFNSSLNTWVSVDQSRQVVVWDLRNGLEQLAFQLPYFDASGISPQRRPFGNSITNTNTNTDIVAQAEIEKAIENGKTGKVITTNQFVKNLNKKKSKRDLASVTALAISPNGKLYSYADKDGVVRLLDKAGKMRFTHSGHHGAVATGVVFSADGKQIISVGRDTDIQILDVATGRVKQILRGHENPIKAVAVSSDQKFLATAGDDTRVMLWNAKTGKLEKILSGHLDFVNSVSFSRYGKRLATASADGRILLWNVATGKLSNTLLGHRSEINVVTFGPNGKFLASGGKDSQVILWDVSTGRKVQIFAEHQSAISSLSFHPNGKTLVSVGEDSKMLVWDTTKRKLIKQIFGATSTKINAVVHDSIGQIVVGDEAGEISEWNIGQDIRKSTTTVPIKPLIKKIINLPIKPQVNKTNSTNVSQTLGVRQFDNERTIQLAKLKNEKPSEGVLSQFMGQLLDWVFPVAEAALPGQGPGGPILVVTSSCPACGLFNDYYAEILLNEGLNAFAVEDILNVNAATLAAYDVVILASMPLTGLQVTMFTDWVNAGGNFIAIKPDSQLADLLGLTVVGSTISEGYLLVDTSQSPGNGIVGRAMQFHGTADRYTLSGASSLATLYTDVSTATTNPALSLNGVGAGQAAAFSYDLATSIVYTRQGNPAWQAQERDGLAPIRSDDKFYGDAIGDPQSDWVDLVNNFDIPQADEQQRLFANLILQMNLVKKPLPRFWYFPRGEKAVIVMTGDDHANNGTEGRFDQFLAQSPAGCSVADWECVRGTSYIYNGIPGVSTLSEAKASAYTAQGFEVGLHVTTSAQDYTQTSLETNYTNQINLFTTDYPSIPAPITMRHHAIVWSDWVTGAEVQLNHGIRLDTSYYYWPPSWVNNKPGYFNGTAMPMRFSRLDGSLIDVYQATTQLTDESGQAYPLTVDTLLDLALGSEGFYGAYVINAHTDLAQIPEATLTVNSAQARGVPIVSSVQMLNWLDARNASSFGGVTWNGNILEFTVTADTAANGLQVMVPANSTTGVVLTIASAGNPVNFNIDSIKGMQYALFTVATGTYTVTYGIDNTLPQVVSNLPADGAVDVTIATAITATFSEAINPSTLVGSNFELKDSAGTPVVANVTYDSSTKTAILTPTASLSVLTTYTATIKGGVDGVTDVAGNALATDVVWSFITFTGPNCPCSAWDSSTLPITPSVNDPSAVELGVKFTSDFDGYINGIRFYQANIGSYIGNLWNSNGQLLATANYTATTPGWQQVDFAGSIAITANTVYVASYYAVNGNQAEDNFYFASSGVDNTPIHLLQDGVSGGNGLFAYSASSTFPSNTFQSSNYWIDVIFDTTGSDTIPPMVTTQNPTPGATEVPTVVSVTATFNEAMDAATIDSATFELRDPNDNLVSASISYDSVTNTATLTPIGQLVINTTYTVRVVGGTTDPRVKDIAGNALAANATWSFTTFGGLNCPCSAWDSSALPNTPSVNDPGAAELGVKFTSDYDGYITGIRFYQANIGSYIGNLWGTNGQQLASANYTATTPGWQQVDFTVPVAISANTVYVASYFAATGNYAGDSTFFANSGVDNTPIQLLQDGGNGGNGLYLYSANSAFPTNTYLASNYWVDVVFDTSVPADVIPPTVVAQNPTPGANGIANTVLVTATFSEVMDTATINSTTFELRDSNNNLVSATIAYNSGTNTVTLTPVAQLDPSSTYSVRVAGGTTDPRVKDLAGNALVADVSWTFTTITPSCSVSTSSIWPTNPTPSVITDPDTSSVELGVKFRSDIDGFICGIRFYKSSTNNGPHIGSLWSSTGQLLASGTFQNETASGWQQMNFGSPVAITANNIYIASYLAPVGKYSVDNNYFATGVLNNPLNAPGDAEVGGNGLYLYGFGGFPTNSFQSTNYWVDVIFTTTLPPDTTPPTVSTMVPVSGATEINVADSIEVTFNEAMDSLTINSTSFELRDSNNSQVVATISYNPISFTATLNPSSPLAAFTNYNVTIISGVNGVKDSSGNALATDFIWSFTTDIDPCSPRINPIVCENSFTGNPASEWDVSGAGDLSIQGFATDISVDLGETVRFKVDTPSTDYRLDIYRMGYYGGDGARIIATVEPSVSLPQNQPSCLTDSSGLVDCGNWTESASWAVPVDATSGVYFAKVIREDGANTGLASHVIFIVRDDAGSSDILFQTSDTTWQSYNDYGGSNLYGGNGPGVGVSGTGRTYKVSYNRPFVTRNVDNGQDWVFNAEYPMIRWLEANGYNVSYFTGIDSDRLGSLISNHKIFLSVGHDEYWSQAQRNNVEVARGAGVHLTFFSGNEVFWKTRWENSIDVSGTPYRTMVCYKETHEGAKIDPLPNIWTGTWRDPRFSPPADGGRPENELTGTIFLVNAGATTSITVPEEDGKMRFWRNTNIATLSPGTEATLPFGTLGYEWDEDIDNGFRPAGLMQLSSTTVDNAPILVDFGSTFGTGSATHALTLYRDVSGALVFGAGTVQWSWGLDDNHDRAGTLTSQDMQQATTNLFADMGVQPDTLQAGLLAASASTDLTEPSSVINSPIAGATISQGTSVTIQGTASDTGGGRVGGVEVSVDGGLTWNVASGRSSWSYVWNTPNSSATVSIKSRAVDDSLNLEIPGAGISVNVGVDTTPPIVVSMTPVDNATGIGLGTTVSATFSEEMEPTSITSTNFHLRDASNTVIPAVVSYSGITATLTPTNGLLTSNTLYTATIIGGAGGVSDLSATSLTTDVNWQFTTGAEPNCASGTATIWPPSTTPAVVSENDSNAVELGVKFRTDVDGFICGIRFYKGSTNTGSHSGSLWDNAGQLLATTTFTNETASGWQQVNFSNPVPIIANTTYIASYHTSVGGYSVDGGYFAGTQINNPPLNALESSSNGGNGVYSYGLGGFPFNSFNSGNYWVDVVFTQ